MTADEVSAPVGPGSAVLAGGEQTEAERAPDAAEPVDRPGADRVVDAEVLEQVDAEDHDDTPATAPMITAPERADPVAGAGDGDQAGEEAVDGDAASHFLIRG